MANMNGNPDNNLPGGKGRLFSDSKNTFFFSTGDSRLYLLIPQKPGNLQEFSGEAQGTLLEKLVKKCDLDLNSRIVAEYWKNPITAVSALNLNLTDRCNLACIYCYARGGNYNRLSEDMTRETARWGVNAAFATRDPDRDFRIEFFGGEPLLNLPVIEDLLNWQENDPTWKTFPNGTVNRISTNLSINDDKALQILKQGKFIVSVSLDGDSSTQDLQRPFKDGKGSFAIIHENLLKIRKMYPDALMVGRMTVYKHDDRLVASVEKFVQEDIFDYFSIYPAAVQDEKNKGSSHFSTTFKDQFLSLSGNYVKWVGNGRFKGILEVNRYCENILTGKTVLNHCRGGGGYFTLSPDKSVHPCHRLVGDTGWDLGPFDWNEEKPAQRLAERLRPWQTHVGERKVCSVCSLRFLCGGGCKQQQLIATGSLLGNDPRVCAFSQLLFEAASRVIKPLLLNDFENEERREAYEANLKKSFSELTRMFVLCGQPVLANGRAAFETPVNITIGDRIYQARAVDWSKTDGRR